MQVTDKFGNAVEVAESVKMLLQGLELLDGGKDGCIKKVTNSTQSNVIRPKKTRTKHNKFMRAL